MQRVRSVPRKLLPQWNIGIIQAKEALSMSKEKRVENFGFLYDEDGPHLNPLILEKLKPEQSDKTGQESRLNPDTPPLLVSPSTECLLVGHRITPQQRIGHKHPEQKRHKEHHYTFLVNKDIKARYKKWLPKGLIQIKKFVMQTGALYKKYTIILFDHLVFHQLHLCKPCFIQLGVKKPKLFMMCKSTHLKVNIKTKYASC